MKSLKGHIHNSQPAVVALVCHRIIRRDYQLMPRGSCDTPKTNVIAGSAVSATTTRAAQHNACTVWHLRDLNEPYSVLSKFDNYFNSDIYIRLDVKNNSSKKLSGFTFCAYTISSAVMQIGDAELIALSANVPVALGDLQPKREMVIHVLAGSFWAYNISDTKSALVFSADELGRVKYKFPLPFYIKLRLRNWASWIIAAVGLLSAAISILAIVNVQR